MSLSPIRKRAVDGLKAGDNFTVWRTFGEEDIRRFADISRDYNPVHFDERFAAAKHFQGRICHGLLVGTLLTEIGGQIGWLASGMQFAFRKPVYPGQTVRCDFKLTEVDEKGRARAEALFTNGSGEIVLEAVLTGILPGSEEKRIMKRMPVDDTR